MKLVGHRCRRWFFRDVKFSSPYRESTGVQNSANIFGKWRSTLDPRQLDFDCCTAFREETTSAVTILPLADISQIGHCVQFGIELHSRSRILSSTLHISQGIDMTFYETLTKTYFNPPDYTHMHSRTDINQHGRQRSSLSAVFIITPSPSVELNALTPSYNSHPVK